jgi:hypothetical protein
MRPTNTCPTCKIAEKSKNLGYCLDCNRERNRNYYCKNQKKLLDQAKIRSMEHYHKHREEISQLQREYDNSFEGKNKAKEYYLKNRERLLNRQKEYQKSVEGKNTNNLNLQKRYFLDGNYRIGEQLSTSLRTSLKSQNVSKSKRAIELLGCTIEEFKVHIEKQWQPGMTWKNNTTNGWHLDHKRCKASFKLENLKEQQECFHFSNYQPLWADKNRKKSSWYKEILYRKNKL